MTIEAPGNMSRYVIHVEPKPGYEKRLSEKHLKEFSVFACYFEDLFEGARNVMRARLGDSHYLMVTLTYRKEE